MLPLRAIADAIMTSDADRDAPAGAKPTKGIGKGTKPARAAADGDTDKGSNSVLGRSIKKLLSPKSKTGVAA